MANRLNVLVGATLEQNVEKQLNAELAKLNLNALELEAKFDNNFKDIVDNIKKAIDAVDFSKMNNGLSIAAQTIGGIGAGFGNVTGFVDKANKAVVDFDGNLKSASHTIQNMNGQEITATIKYDKDGNEIGEIAWNDKSADIAVKETEKQLNKVYDLYDKAAKKVGDFFDVYKGITDVTGKEFVDNNTFDGFENKLNELANQFSKTGKSAKDFINIQEQLVSLISNIDVESSTVDSKIFEESKKSEKATTALKKRALELQKQALGQIIEENRHMEENYVLTQKQLDVNRQREAYLGRIYGLIKNENIEADELREHYSNIIALMNNSSAELNNLQETQATTAAIELEKKRYAELKEEIQQVIVQKKLLNSSDPVKSSIHDYLKNQNEQLDESLEKFKELEKNKNNIISLQEFNGFQTKSDNASNGLNLALKWLSEYSKIQDKLDNEAVTLQKKFGADFDAAAFREIYNVNDKILDLLKTEGTTWKDIEHVIESCTDKAKEFKSNLVVRADKGTAREYLTDVKQKLNEMPITVDFGVGFDGSDFKVYQYLENELADVEKILYDSNSTTEDIIAATKRLVDAEGLVEDQIDSINKKRTETNRIIVEQQKANKQVQESLSKVSSKFDYVEAKMGSAFNKSALYPFKAELEKISAIINNQDSSIEDLEDALKTLRHISSNIDLVDKIEDKLQKDDIVLKSRYGDLYDSEELRKFYDISKEIEEELRQTIVDWEKINRLIKQADRNGSNYKDQLSATAKEIKKIEDKAKVFDSSLGRFIQFYGFGQLFGVAKQGFTQMFEQIKLVDSSMVELKKVTSETEAIYDRFLDNSSEKAKALGVTMTDYIDSVTNFARMDVGGFEAAQEVAEVANIFQQVSENLTADQASEYLISNMKAWGYEANNAIEIVDVLNNLSNKYAITIDGLGESLTRSSAAMMSANNTLEQTAALTIAANNVIQDPLVVGNALKTVSINKLVA